MSITEMMKVRADIQGLIFPTVLLCNRGGSRERQILTEGSQWQWQQCGSQQQPSSQLQKRKVNEQNKDSRKKVKQEVKINLSPREVAHLENGEMLNDTHIDAANQMFRKQFPDVRGLQSPLLGQSLSFAVTEPPFVQVLHVDGLHWVTVTGVHTSLVKVLQCVQHCRSFCRQLQF